MKKFILPILLLSLTACKQQPMGEAKTFTLDDFKTVIDKKVAEWKGTEMEQYLPELEKTQKQGETGK